MSRAKKPKERMEVAIIEPSKPVVVVDTPKEVKVPPKPSFSLSDKLIPIQEDSIENILGGLQKPSETIKDIALRTDLPDVYTVVQMQAYAEWCRYEGQEPSALIIEKHVKTYMDDMVSDHRKGRAEIVKAVQAVKEMAEGKRSRWTGKEVED